MMAAGSRTSYRLEWKDKTQSDGYSAAAMRAMPAKLKPVPKLHAKVIPEQPPLTEPQTARDCGRIVRAER